MAKEKKKEPAEENKESAAAPVKRERMTVAEAISHMESGRHTADTSVYPAPIMELDNTKAANVFHRHGENAELHDNPVLMRIGCSYYGSANRGDGMTEKREKAKMFDSMRDAWPNGGGDVTYEILPKRPWLEVKPDTGGKEFFVPVIFKAVHRDMIGLIKAAPNSEFARGIILASFGKMPPDKEGGWTFLQIAEWCEENKGEAKVNGIEKFEVQFEYNAIASGQSRWTQLFRSARKIEIPESVIVEAVEENGVSDALHAIEDWVRDNCAAPGREASWEAIESATHDVGDEDEDSPEIQSSGLVDRGLVRRALEKWLRDNHPECL